MKVEIIIAVIIFLAVAAFIFSYITRKKHYRIVDQLEEQKNQLLDMPIIDDVHVIKTLKLTGQTKESFEKWEKEWKKVETISIPEIENKLYEAERSVDKLRFSHARVLEDGAKDKLSETKQTLLLIQDALTELVRGEEKNKQELDRIKETYQNIRKKLLTQSFSFGPALEQLEQKLTLLETDFSLFSEFTAQGDHIEAKEVLENVNAKTETLDAYITEIPMLLKEINGEFIEQLKEIKTGYDMLKEEDFQFPDDHIEDKISEVEQERTAAGKLVGQLEIDAAKEKIPAIEEEIDQLYDILETEMSASQYVNDHRDKMEQLIDYLTHKNNKLLIEIDRVSQSYKLNHDELKQTQGFKDQLEGVTETFRHYLEGLQNKAVAYSEVQEAFERNLKELEDIDKKQNDIAQQLKELRKEETHVKQLIDDFEFNMRGMKRYIEKQHLPGLPTEYMDLFFAVTKKIESLSIEINKLRIDMDEIKKMADFIADDVELLIDKTEEIVDTALLTEYMMQYANRYRQSNPQIASAVQKSSALFSQEYDYREALETISTALEEVEPGAYKKVENTYFNEVKPSE